MGAHHLFCQSPIVGYLHYFQFFLLIRLLLTLSKLTFNLLCRSITQKYLIYYVEVTFNLLCRSIVVQSLVFLLTLQQFAFKSNFFYFCEEVYEHSNCEFCLYCYSEKAFLSITLLPCDMCVFMGVFLQGFYGFIIFHLICS